MYEKMFNLTLKRPPYKSYVRPAIMSESEMQCLKECKTEILQSAERSTVRVTCGVQLNDKKNKVGFQ